MPALSIPEAIVENGNLNANAKFAFADCFARLKKGEKVEVTLSNVGESIALSTEDLIGSLRQLAGEGYAHIEETVDRLDDMVAEQKMRLTVHIHAEPLPLFPQDETSVNLRRYPPAYEEKPGFDVVKVGRMIYRATVSRFMDEHSLTVRARHGDNVEQATLVDARPFAKENDAWGWFDGFVEEMRRNHAAGLVLAGAAGDDPHGAVVAHLVEHGWEPDEAREASEATIGEGDPQMRIEACLRLLSSKRPPRALTAGSGPDADPDAEIFANAARFALAEGGLTVAMLRREFGLGSIRASEIMTRLEAAGIVGPRQGAKPREVLVTPERLDELLGVVTIEAVEAVEDEDPYDPYADPPRADEIWPEVVRWVATRKTVRDRDIEKQFGTSFQTALVLLTRLGNAGVTDDKGLPEAEVLMDGAAVERLLAGEADGGE